MPPKKTKTPDRVSKSAQATPSSKGTPAGSRSLAKIMTQEYFYLLWLCYSTSDQKPDYEKIATKLGITRHAAHQRFYTLRNAFKDFESGDGDQGVAGTPTRAPRAPKTPKTPKVDDDEEREDSDDAKDSKIKEESDEPETEGGWCEEEDDVF